MNSSAKPSRARRSASSASTCACTDTSSAETGSSATRNSGAGCERAGQPDALALAAGELVRIALARAPAARPTCASSAATRGPPLAARAETMDRQPVRHLRADAPARVEARIRVLEHELHPPPQAAARRRASSCRRTARVPALGASSPSSSRPIVLLPEPHSPTSPTASPRPIASDTSVTACTGAARARKPRAAKCLLRRSAATSAVMPVPASAGSAWRAPARGSISGGGAASQPGARSAQRGAKAQPGGSACGGGTVPGIGTGNAPSSPGALRSSADRVGMQRRARRSRAALPCSTISPAYITAPGRRSRRPPAGCG